MRDHAAADGVHYGTPVAQYDLTSGSHISARGAGMGQVVDWPSWGYGSWILG